MRTIYIDANTFKCFISNADGRVAIETDFFDGKCKRFVEGYRLIPAGSTWVDENGILLVGEMFVVSDDFNAMTAAQEQYEEMLSMQEDMRSALDAIYGGVTDDGA